MRSPREKLYKEDGLFFAVIMSTSKRGVQAVNLMGDGIQWLRGRGIYYSVGGSDITLELLTLVDDPQNLQPHEVGLVKLKYGLTQLQLRIPDIVRKEYPKLNLDY